MDIYQRRRLTAVGVFVTFISVIAIAAGNGGGDEGTSPVTPGEGSTGASGAQGAQSSLSKSDYIAQADAICAEANSAIAGASGVGTATPDPGVDIRRKELNQLKSLPAPSKGNPQPFLKAFKQLVDATKKRELANKRADTEAQGEAQMAIDGATDDIGTTGDAFGFTTCSSLDATTSGATGTTGAAGADTGTGTVDPGTATDSTGTVTPPATDTTPAETPPADTTPPATGGDTGGNTGGGDTGGSSGGVSP